MASPYFKRRIQQILPFGIIWFLASVVYTFLEQGLLGSLAKYPTTGHVYSFEANMITTPISATVVGLLIGFIEIRYFNRLFAQLSLGRKMLYKTAVYAGISIAFLFITTLANTSLNLQQPIFSSAVLQEAGLFLGSFPFWSVELCIAAILVVSLFYSEVNENLGVGLINNFLTGKYYQPIEEERIFMFLDMRSSTTIAEQLGHLEYFKLLQEYYSEFSDPIIKHEAEIYKYVGDEIILSWKLEKGIVENNCLRCFFAMQKALEAQAPKYLKKYGLVPSFKAGLHYGLVTIGEIGDIKKEIMFTGDILNSTARIQGLCNTLGVDLLISAELLKKLDIKEDFASQDFGFMHLRGRDEEINLFTVLELVYEKQR